MTIQLPAALPVDLTIKIGEPQTNTRKSVGASRQLQFVLDEGYAVFRAKIKAVIAQHNEVRWRDDSPIMVKPTTNATQAQYEELAADDPSLRLQLHKLWGLSTR